MNVKLQKFIEQNIDLIENNDFDTLYSECAIETGFVERLTQVLLDANIDPLPHMNHVVPLMYQGCDIEYIIVPDNIGYLPSRRAFSDCARLHYVSLPATLKSFGYETFYHSPKLKQIEFRGTLKQFYNSNTRIEEWAKGSNISKVICSDGVVDVDERA